MAAYPALLANCDRSRFCRRVRGFVRCRSTQPEQYPPNQALSNPLRFSINLQYEIAGTENRIAVERMRYNNAVQSYNQQIQQFPNSVLAQAFGFKSKSFFQTTTPSMTRT